MEGVTLVGGQFSRLYAAGKIVLSRLPVGSRKRVFPKFTGPQVHGRFTQMQALSKAFHSEFDVSDSWEIVAGWRKSGRRGKP